MVDPKESEVCMLEALNEDVMFELSPPLVVWFLQGESGQGIVFPL